MTEQQKQETAGAGLGTFAGVFTPSVLTILGIILFLRLGYVVGQAGILRALLIIRREARESLEKARKADADADEIGRLEAACKKADEECERLKRRADKAKSRADQTVEQAEALIGRPLEPDGESD